jgi:L-threonylcarbamoyladenylate synthase
MLARHYAPKTSTFLVTDVLSEVKKHAGKKIGILVFKSSLNYENITEVVLSKEGSMQEAASKLYAAMHALDHKNLDIIIAERFPDFGLGNSINDRLQRATFK